jgi:hypothetical protein
MGGTSGCDGSTEEESCSESPHGHLTTVGPLVQEALQGHGGGSLQAAGVNGFANGGPQIRTAGSLPSPPPLERAASIHPKDEIRAETTFLELLFLAIPSMLLSGAAPLAVTVQVSR